MTALAPDLLVERHGGALHLVMNRPDRLNAVSLPMVELALEAIASAQSAPGIRAIVLRGAGRAFCAGGDLRSMVARDVWSLAEHEAYFHAVHRMTEAIFTSKKPTLAVTQGAVYGAGLAFALACDLRLAQTNTRIGLAFLNVGLAGDHAVAWLLARVIGPARAKEAMLRTATFSAAEAHTLGLVSALLPVEAEDAALEEEILRLTARPSFAVQAIKSSVDETDFSALRAALARDAKVQAQAISTQDHRNLRDGLLAGKV